MEDEFECLATLRKELVDANKQYYMLDQPLITDAAYDALMRELLSLEAKHPDWVTPDSPTQRIGGEVAKEYTKVRHLEPLLSLDNAFAPSDLREFDRRVRQVSPTVDYVVELKIDGLTVALTYEDGLMVRGATRGDGSLWLKQRLSNNRRLIKGRTSLFSVLGNNKLDNGKSGGLSKWI